MTKTIHQYLILEFSEFYELVNHVLNEDVWNIIYKMSLPDLKIGDKLDGEGGFCARGKLITSQKSKDEKILPLGLTDNAILKKNINKDQVIRLEDVELNLPKEVIEARDYQYNLI